MLKAFLLGFGAARAQNPFSGASFYVNPSFQAEIDSSIATASGQTKINLQTMRGVASAYWIDVKAKVHGNGTDSLEGILADAASKKQLATVILYDLPNRDCDAKSSNGEICCTYKADKTCDYTASGDCSAGLKEYMSEYVDPFAEVLAKYHEQIPIVVIIEPDSLPNLATNQGNPNCGNAGTTNAYLQGIPYAVNQVAKMAPKASIYVDAAHGGWLGWDDNLQKYIAAFAKMQISSKIRGFATNVANYQPVGVMCPWSGGTRNDYCLNGQHQSDACCSDPCKLEGQYNDGNNELNYIQAFSKSASTQIPGFKPYFVIDTGRNGVAAMRKDCANWCNPRGSGVGFLPAANPAGTPDFVDAFFWLKTPGESDGCTQTLPDGTACPRYDSMCGSLDSIGSQSGEPRCPQAGLWFDFQVKMLAENAHFQ